MSNLPPHKKYDDSPASAVELTVVRNRLLHPGPHHPDHHAHASLHERDAHERHGDQQHVVSNALQQTRQYTVRIPSKPITFRFAQLRWKAGIRFLLGAVVALGTGGFLISQIQSTPSLRVQMGIVSAVCVFGGLALLQLAVRDLLGRLRVDSQGIQLLPRYLGFSIPWSDLRGWEMDSLAFRFTTAGSKHAYTTDRELLSPLSGSALSELLSLCAPEKKLSR